MLPPPKDLGKRDTKAHPVKAAIEGKRSAAVVERIEIFTVDAPGLASLEYSDEDVMESLDPAGTEISSSSYSDASSSMALFVAVSLL